MTPPPKKSFSFFKIFFLFSIPFFCLLGYLIYQAKDVFIEIKGEIEHLKGDKYYQKGDLEKAIPLFKKAVADGSADAANDLGIIYGKLNSKYQNDKLKMEYFHIAAARGSQPAMYNLGLNYGNINHHNPTPPTADDIQKALAWYHASLVKGPMSCSENDLAIFHTLGYGVKINKQQAKLEFAVSAIDFITENKSLAQLKDDEEFAEKYADFRIAELTKQAKPKLTAAEEKRIATISKGIVADCWD